jgi:quaternary ammonium compound-resistance protein SugE
MSFSPWLYLLLAGLLEVGFTTFLKLSNGFTRVIPTLLFIMSISGSFWFLQKSAAAIPLGTAYAIWTSIGVLGTVLMQALFFDGTLGTSKIFFMILLIVAIIGLKMSS